MSQCANILRYMEETGGITQAEAVTEFGCYRLSARIADLKAQGVPIKTEMVKRKKSFRRAGHIRKILRDKGGDTVQRGAIKFLRSYYEAAKQLAAVSPEEALNYLMAIMEYGFDDTEPDAKGAAGDMFALSKPLIDKERLSESERKSTEYRVWRTTVLARDRYTCQDCGVAGVPLNVHHIKPYAEYIEERCDVDNGVTLCVPCHKARHKRRI